MHETQLQLRTNPRGCREARRSGGRRFTASGMAAGLLLALALPALPQPAGRSSAGPAPANAQGNAEFEALQAHFERVASQRSERLFRGITTVPQWEKRKAEARAGLEKMLWHNLRFPETAPAVTTTHRESRANYTIENLVIETAPDLFLTANLYLPKEGRKPFPVVLYQCGHASKQHYSKHGAWFAEHAIAALVMDNIEMGEVEFTHHGVYANGWFHWYSRGFSPLAVELWNARRAVDYLASRPDLDPKRIGATGRSGGGMTTFFLAALDERIAASAPVSGTLSTNGWVRQRLSAAHCDCQYPVNAYGMLYSEIGALIAPRPHLQCNADSDPGFPMNAFDELIGKMRRIYQLYGAAEALQTAVAPGGHQDTEAIRIPVYSFFLKHFLGRKTELTEEGPYDDPPPEALVCYRSGLPLKERLSRIDEDMIPVKETVFRPMPEAARSARRRTMMQELRNEVFRYFPEQAPPFDPQWSGETTAQGRRVQRVSFTSLEGLRVKATYSLPEPGKGRLPALLIADHRRGIPVWGNEQPLERNQWGGRAVLIVETVDSGSRALERNLRSFSDNDPVHHMKRQAMVAGTTIESIQVYEILRAIEFLRSLPEVDGGSIAVMGKGEMGVNAMYAALIDGRTQRVVLQSPTASHRQGPHYLGVLRYTDIPEVAAVLGPLLRVSGEIPPGLGFVKRCGYPPECLQ
jgi:cephalosporin-C deacetylase-like acetyl esterase